MNIIENIASEKLPYHYDFGKEEINNFDIVNAIKSLQIIQEFYKKANYLIVNIDDYINYLFVEYLFKINELDENTFKMEYAEDILKIKNIINEIKENYCFKDVLEYIEKNFKEIFEYYSKENCDTERNSINIHIRLELRNATIKKVAKYITNKEQENIIEYMTNNDIIIFFDNIEIFKNFKRVFIEKLDNENIIKKLLYYRYIELLDFLSKNLKLFKESSKYDLIIDAFINNIRDEKKHIYQRQRECQNLIQFLKQIKEIKVRKIEKLHKKLICEVNEEIRKTGHSIKQSIDLKETIMEYKELLKKKDTNDFTKLVYPNAININGRNYMLIENVDKIDVGVTSEFFEQDPYYCSIRIMQVEQFIIPTFNRFLFNYTIKNIGYRRLEKLIIRLIKQVFSTLFIEYEEDEIKKDIKCVIFSMKNCYKKYNTNAERNYMYYIHSTYLISYIEKLLRKLYVSIYERDIYIEDNKITLGSIFKEKDKSKLEILIGENLFKWIRYFLFNVENTHNRFEEKIGYSYRNRICHYRDISAIENTSNKIYYDVIYLFFNLIIALHFNVCNYPCEESEKIIVEQFEKINTELLY